MTELAGSWAFHLAHAFWQCTLVGAVVLALMRLVPAASPRFRHALVLLATIKFVLPPMLPLPTGIFSAAPPVAEITVVRDALWRIDSRLLALLMLVHAAGTATAFLRLAAEAVRLRGIVRRSSAFADGVLLSAEIAVPMAVGIVRPAILIPSSLMSVLTADELDDVLAHERQHLRSGDVRLNAFQAVVSALWWFHPLVYLLDREGRALREERCDDAVIGTTAGGAARYARTLLHAACAATARVPFASAAISEPGSPLLRRVRRIAAAGFVPRTRLGVTATLAITLAALLLLPGLRVSRANRVAFDHATIHALHH